MRLVNVQLWAVLGDMLSIGGTVRKKPRVLYVGILLFTVAMSAVSFFYSFMIGSGLKLYGSLELLPAMMMAVGCVVIFMTTVFKIKGTVFGFRDYDLVMSLPVSTGAIVGCRLLILYAFNFLFVMILIIPMMIAYGILAQAGLRFYLIGFLVMFFIPMVPIVIASVIGTIIAYAASRFRHSNLLNIVFSLGLLMVIILLSFTTGDNGRELVDMSQALTRQVNSIYPLAGMYTDAVVRLDLQALVLFITISLAAFLVYTGVVMRIFKRMNTSMLTGAYHVNFKMGELKTSSPIRALYTKEMKRYFASSLYVMNTAFGIVLLTVGAVALFFVDLGEVLGDPSLSESIAYNSPLYVTFCIVMSCTTMASISLEGRNLWILKSMPVSPKTIFFSKIAVNLTITAPAVIDAVLIGIALKLGVWQTLLSGLMAIVLAVFISLYGLLINLLLPNFSWTTEVVVIKQSAACMVTIFSAMGYVGIQFLLLFFIPVPMLAYLSYLILTIVLCLVLYAILMSYGKRRYHTL